jgi:DNA-binding transcriptional ArsR family regulator
VHGVFEALGDPVRRTILELLAASEQPTGALVAALQSRLAISQPAVSQHLKVLREADLVSVRAEGTRRIYALDQAGLDAARAWLSRLADPLEPFHPAAGRAGHGTRARPPGRSSVAAAAVSRATQSARLTTG